MALLNIELGRDAVQLALESRCEWAPAHLCAQAAGWEGIKLTVGCGWRNGFDGPLQSDSHWSQGSSKMTHRVGAGSKEGRKG